MSTGTPAALHGREKDGIAVLTEGPARVGIWDSMRARWRLTLLPIVILLPIALALGLARSPRYTAEARLIVGRLDISNPGLSGYVTATQSLAAAYSRAVTAAQVIEPVARELHLSPHEVSSRLAGSPIQESPVFRVIATGGSSVQAIALANDTSRALIAYVATLNRENPDGPRLLKQYVRATRAFDRASVAQQDAQGKFRTLSTPVNEAAFTAASTARASAELEMTTIGSLYASSEAGQATSSLVSTLNTANTAASDRNSVLELLAFLAVAVGLAIGAALATAAANRPRRAPRPPATG